MDFSKNHPISLLKGRFGIYEKNQFQGSQQQGVNDQATQLEFNGGSLQQERMINGKRRSLDRALWFSYQGANVKKIGEQETVRALINPNKLLQDYDEKILSIGFEHNIKSGDIIEWCNTNSKWLVYLQDLTELAYFKGRIRKCSYEIKWENDEGDIQSTYVAIVGPSEKTLNSTIKHTIRIDNPNYSLTLLVPKNDETVKYFTRYNKFYLQGDKTCWQIEAIDGISTPGVLQVHAMEYYANEFEDDIENGIVQGLVAEEEEDPNTNIESYQIVGETFIKVKKHYDFVYNGTEAHAWYVDKKYPIELKVNETDPRIVTVYWDSTFSGQFDLYYGNISKTIVVESLF